MRIEDVDVTDAEALSTVLRDVRANMGPLRGVFHSAMVLDEQFIHALTRERLRRVLRPKVEKVSMALESAGIRRMTTKEALQALEHAMGGHDAQLGAFAIDWTRWETLNPQKARLPMYRMVCALSQASKTARPAVALARESLLVETDQRTHYSCGTGPRINATSSGLTTSVKLLPK